MARTSGKYERTNVAGETVDAFVPHSLPPARPKLDLGGPLAAQLQTAETSLAQLRAATRMIPSLAWFVYAFVRKEAVISSQIEGTQASLDDLLAAEIDAPTRADENHIEEVSNYIDALNFARAQLARPRELPLSVRLLNGAHKRLMAGVRGQDKSPGRVRTSQNWIGGTRPGNAQFVPPPPGRVPDLLGDLESWLHADSDLPPLVRTGLTHVQFESIHPYLDGNGRIGRLLITLCLEHCDLLPQPILYLSLFFKRHRRAYYDRLDRVRTDGDWEGWLEFFLEAVDSITRESIQVTGALFELVAHDRLRYVNSERATVVGARLFELLPEHPVLTVSLAADLCETTKPTATKAIESMCGAVILEEITGRSRDRVYQYAAYLDLIRTGTEL
jgi:Fic family protein